MNIGDVYPFWSIAGIMDSLRQIVINNKSWKKYGYKHIAAAVKIEYELDSKLMSDNGCGEKMILIAIGRR